VSRTLPAALSSGLVALAAVLAAGAAAQTRAPAADPGVTPTTVVIGGTVPLSGIASAFGAVGPGAQAYFKYVNARGGVNGRKIDYRIYDDGYDPSRTVELTRKLISQDRVFAIFNSVGTANNLAIQPFLNALKVPQLFVGDGSSALHQPRKYPWTMGFLPSYRGEGAVYGRVVSTRNRRAKIAVLYENTDFGKDLVRGLEGAIRGRGPRVVAKQGYEFTDADVSSTIARLKASKADTLMLFATPKFAIQAFVAAHKLRWRPKVYVGSVSIEPGIMAIARFNAPELTKGALSIAYVKNPDDPIWNKDPATKLYRTIMRTYYPAGNAADVYNWYGMTVAWTMVETLRKAGRNLTRAGVLRAAQHLDLGNNPFLLPGIRLKTSPTLYYPIRKVFLYRYDNKQWVKSSGLLAASGPGV
jgi:ABC-type branched-subunit amino acid transport system substrate-binding protein